MAAADARALPAPFGPAPPVATAVEVMVLPMALEEAVAAPPNPPVTRLVPPLPPVAEAMAPTMSGEMVPPVFVGEPVMVVVAVAAPPLPPAGPLLSMPPAPPTAEAVPWIEALCMVAVASFSVRLEQAAPPLPA